MSFAAGCPLHKGVVGVLWGDEGLGGAFVSPGFRTDGALRLSRLRIRASGFMDRVFRAFGREVWFEAEGVRPEALNLEAMLSLQDKASFQRLTLLKEKSA